MAFANRGDGRRRPDAVGKPAKPKNPPLPAKAKHVIFLHVRRPEQADTFDYKPKMYPLKGKTIQVKTFGRGGKKTAAAWYLNGSSSSTVKGRHQRPLPASRRAVRQDCLSAPMTADSPIHGRRLMMNSATSQRSAVLGLGELRAGTKTKTCPATVMLDPPAALAARKTDQRIHARGVPASR